LRSRVLVGVLREAGEGPGEFLALSDGGGGFLGGGVVVVELHVRNGHLTKVARVDRGGEEGNRSVTHGVDGDGSGNNVATVANSQHEDVVDVSLLEGD